MDNLEFPNSLVALNGKHVIIDALSNSGFLYFNFVALDIGCYGKNSDEGILTNSALGRGLENGHSILYS